MAQRDKIPCTKIAGQWRFKKSILPVKKGTAEPDACGVHDATVPIFTLSGVIPIFHSVTFSKRNIFDLFPTKKLAPLRNPPLPKT